MGRTRRDVARMAAAGVAVAALAGGARAAAPKKLRILILGGTGFTGPHQVRYALSRGHQVTLFNRGRQPRDWPGEVEELIGDRNTGDLKALAGKTWDVCIDNPTTLPFWVRDAGQALKGQIGQYIFISTISVYARNDKPADENDALIPYTGPDARAERGDPRNVAAAQLYGPLKALSEAEAHRQFGAAATVIRPGLIVGPGDETDRFSYWPVRLANDAGRWGPSVLAPGDGTDPVQFIDARDLAEWTVRMAESRTFGTFNATGPAKPLRIADMLAGVARGVKSKPPITWVPTRFLQDKKVSAWGDMPVWVPGQGESEGFARRDIRKALAAGLTYRPLPVTAADTLAWFRQQPPERQAKLKSGLTPERETALLAEWTASGRAAGG